jgi:hypothetical protein
MNLEIFNLLAINGPENHVQPHLIQKLLDFLRLDLQIFNTYLFKRESNPICPAEKEEVY